MIIAIDGPAAAGKGTLARRIAEHFGLAFLDTGRLYRAVGAKVLQAGKAPEDAAAAAAAARGLTPAHMDAPNLRDEGGSERGPIVSAPPGGRAAPGDFPRPAGNRGRAPIQGVAGAGGCCYIRPRSAGHEGSRRARSKPRRRRPQKGG